MGAGGPARSAVPPLFGPPTVAFPSHRPGLCPWPVGCVQAMLHGWLVPFAPALCSGSTARWPRPLQPPRTVTKPCIVQTPVVPRTVGKSRKNAIKKTNLQRSSLPRSHLTHFSKLANWATLAGSAASGIATSSIKKCWEWPCPAFCCTLELESIVALDTLRSDLCTCS